jgi:hypothetical protein
MSAPGRPGRRARGALAVLLATPVVTIAALLASAPAASASASPAPSQTFDYTGGVQFFNVPSGVTSISIDASGGKGGNAGGSAGVHGGVGGQGGETVATLPVSPGDTLTVVVGGKGGSSGNYGSDGASGGFGAGNGGNGGDSSLFMAAGGGGGGGSSEVDTSANIPLVVAGGGGGGGGGGGLFTYNGGAGGAGANPAGPGKDGYGPGSGDGGAGGAAPSRDGTAGTDAGVLTGAGGGGGAGGGLAGGAGGQGGDLGAGGGGGGGGGQSFAAASATDVTFATTSRTGDGQVVIRWDQPSTTTALTSSLNPSQSGQQVTFTATVAPTSPTTPAPSGVVAFLDGTTEIGEGVLNQNPAADQATFSTSTLTVGSHPITAVYGGDPIYAGSSSSPVTQVVNSATAEATVSPTVLSFGNQPQGTTSSPQVVTVTSTGTGSLVIGGITTSGTNPGSFPLSDDTCSGETIASGASCTVDVSFSPPAGGPASATLVINDNAFDSPQTVGLSGNGQPGFAYHPLAPIRLVDTRPGSGSPYAGKTLGPGGTLTVRVGGVDRVPSNATAAVLNVTVTDTTATSFLTVYPAGSARPLASNLNFNAGQTVPNLVQVSLGTSGSVTFYNQSGKADVVADLEGYNAPDASPAGLFDPVTPFRIADTRPGSGQPYAGQTLGPGSTLDVQATGLGGVPAAGVSAVVLNVTVTDTTASSFLTVYPQGATRPIASNLNFSAGQTVPNRVIVPVGPTGEISVFNQSGGTDVIVDINGWFTDSTPGGTGARFTGMTPTRIVDTRAGSGQPYEGQTLGADDTLVAQVAGVKGIPPIIAAVVANTTVTDTTASSFLTVFPADALQPTSSDLNWTPSQTVSNLTVVGVAGSGTGKLFNENGLTDVVVDVSGYYQD